MVETKPAISEKTKQLKRRIEQTFEILDLQSLAGLIGTLEKMGYRSIATTLEQLLVDEAAAALSGGCKKSRQTAGVFKHPI